jgi:serine/threonine protein kinase
MSRRELELTRREQMPPRARTPQRLRELGAAVGGRVAAASRTACKTGRALAARVRNARRQTIAFAEAADASVGRAARTRVFTVHKQIGEGAYSVVYKVCERQPDGRPRVYAMKRALAHDAAASRRLVGEIELMRRLPPHPNVLDLVAYHLAALDGEASRGYLLLEMCDRGSLAHLLLAREGEPLERARAFRLLLDMAHGLLHLHSQAPPIAHRDLKLENVLLANDGFAKLGDFGSATCRVTPRLSEPAARSAASDEVAALCTSGYRAPEMHDLHRGQALSEKADVWALGICFFKLLCSREPYAPGEERLGALNGSWRARLPDSRCYV